MGRHAALLADVEITADATCVYCASRLVGGMRRDRFGWLHEVQRQDPPSAVHAAFPAEGSVNWYLEA